MAEEQEEDEYLDIYLEEFQEEIQELNDNMLKYEDEGSEEALDQLFRSTHTIKSSSASMEFDTVSELAHKLEDVFDALRNDEIERNDQIFNILYTGVDKLETFYNQIDENGDIQEKNIDTLIENLEKVEKGEEIEEVEKDTEMESSEDVENIKVEADKLDKMLNSIGELTIIQKKIRDEIDPKENDDLRTALDQFKRLGEELRDELMGARMVPVSQIFDRFPRTVRDLSSDAGKNVSLEIEGDDLRLDRTVLEEVGDPVLHMLRNAVDHGIEPPEERKRKDKDPEGQITLSTWREGDEAVITVEDDGRGIDPEKVVDKAIENDIITSNEANSMTKDEKLNLIFNSNLSTNEEVTEVSGRGVGMSIVRQTAERLQGKYSIESELNEGTKVEMRLPITLAIVKCFIIEAGAEKFGIPINGVEHVKNITDEDIKTIEGQEVIVYRDNELPLIDLTEKFSEDGEVDLEQKEFPALIMLLGNKSACLKVGSINQIEEFVIKETEFLNLSSMSGSAILPDGTPIPILDVRNIM
jgi:two-component system chemotaxis sensor kinase CheA